MDTTIQISKELLVKLRSMKLHEKESYESLIWDLLEDRMELNEETKKRVTKAEEEMKKGKAHKWEDVKKELKIDV
jgi:hypothetical protein